MSKTTESKMEKKTTKTVHVLSLGGEPIHFASAAAARRFLDALPAGRRCECAYLGTREVSK
jgi:hypothetical protein